MKAHAKKGTLENSFFTAPGCLGAYDSFPFVEMAQGRREGAGSTPQTVVASSVSDSVKKWIVQGARNSIQSLHAFIRRLRGRIGEPLPPLLSATQRSRFVFFLVVLGMTMNPSIFAQDQVLAQENNNEKRLDLLFDRIIQSLPARERSRVDSAAGMKGASREAIEKIRARDAAKKTSESEATRFRELPPDLKDQVERAMADAKERGEERKAQFIDGRHGKK